MATTQKCELDKFYTHPVIAAKCVSELYNFTNIHDMGYLEPSAGAGAFSNLMSECSAYDLYPEHPNIIQQDYLTSQFVFRKDVCVFGNPPFGTRNKLTNAFIKKSIGYHQVRVIAFILPECFNKFSMQKVFDSSWHLAKSVTLPRDSFVLDNTPYHVPAVFQIWFRGDFLDCDDLREVDVSDYCDHFRFLPSAAGADFFVFGAAPQNTLDISDVSDTNRGYYVKIHNTHIDVREAFSSINWGKYGASSVSGGVSWFGKRELISIFIKEIQNGNE